MNDDRLAEEARQDEIEADAEMAAELEEAKADREEREDRLLDALWDNTDAWGEPVDPI